MSFIEHLDADNWQQNFQLFFEGTLAVLEDDDPYQPIGSAMDDLRSWLCRGGVGRIRLMLADQMEMRGYPLSKQQAIMDFLPVLAHKNRARLLKLAHDKIIPLASALGDFPIKVDADEMLERLAKGERPFEEWMYGQGHTAQEIAAIYRSIDKCLFEQGVIEPENQQRH